MASGFATRRPGTSVSCPWRACSSRSATSRTPTCSPTGWTSTRRATSWPTTTPAARSTACSSRATSTTTAPARRSRRPATAARPRSTRSAGSRARAWPSTRPRPPGSRDPRVERFRMSFRGGGTRNLARGGTGGGRLTPPSSDFARVPNERRAKTVRRIVAFFRPYRGQVVVVLVAIIATSLIGLVNPYLLKLLIDDVIVGGQYDRLNLYVGLMIVLPIVTGLIGVGQSYLNNLIGQSVMQDLRNALYTHIQSLPLRFFTATRTGEIQSRLAYDVGKVRRQVSTETQQRLAEMSAVTEETLSVSGILLGKTFGAQDRSIERFMGLNRELARLQIRQAMVGRWFFMIIGTIFSIMPAFVYWLAGSMAASGNPQAPTAGDIVAFTTLQSRLFFPLGQLLNVQVELQGSLALFDRIFEYLDLDPEIVDSPDAVALEPADVRGEVAFAGVSFHYPPE